jgi:hypothetical protein
MGWGLRGLRLRMGLLLDYGGSPNKKHFGDEELRMIACVEA